MGIWEVMAFALILAWQPDLHLIGLTLKVNTQAMPTVVPHCPDQLATDH
jgi:hypothetical protein